MNISEIANNKDLCCGCNACAVICPKKAIQMIEDEVGQVYPQIDENRCVDCSLCTRVCCEMNNVQQFMPLKIIAGNRSV
jgi:formate hydrogenlyase subunit 6/NADH:ubiquinone oxidoreductase subunit I